MVYVPEPIGMPSDSILHHSDCLIYYVNSIYKTEIAKLRLDFILLNVFLSEDGLLMIQKSKVLRLLAWIMKRINYIINRYKLLV